VKIEDVPAAKEVRVVENGKNRFQLIIVIRPGFLSSDSYRHDADS
jgi:hypothetical protein